MATAPQAVANTTAPKAKSGIKRVNKPRTFYMVYKGNLEAPPQFAFERDALIDMMLTDRDVKVEKITLPTGKPRKAKEGNGAQA